MRIRIFWKFIAYKLIALCVCLTVCFSCSHKNDEYAYFEDFVAYLKNFHGLNVSDDKIYYLIPISGCENCIGLNLDLLSQLPKATDKLQPIIVGETFNEERIKYLKSLSSKYNFLYDKKEIVFQYQTGFTKPMIVWIKNKKCYFHLDVSDFKIEEAKAFFEQHLNFKNVAI